MWPATDQNDGASGDTNPYGSRAPNAIYDPQTPRFRSPPIPESSAPPGIWCWLLAHDLLQEPRGAQAQQLLCTFSGRPLDPPVIRQRIQQDSKLVKHLQHRRATPLSRLRCGALCKSEFRTEREMAQSASFPLTGRNHTDPSFLWTTSCLEFAAEGRRHSPGVWAGSACAQTPLSWCMGRTTVGSEAGERGTCM